MDTSVVYEYLIGYKESHDGNSPSIREIMDGCNMRSESTTLRYLRELESQGLIRMPIGKSRSIRIIGAEWVAPGG